MSNSSTYAAKLG